MNFAHLLQGKLTKPSHKIGKLFRWNRDRIQSQSKVYIIQKLTSCNVCKPNMQNIKIIIKISKKLLK